jgi:hypothetical protein
MDIPLPSPIDKSIGQIRSLFILQIHKKKPLSGLISNILVFFDFLDEFFHEDE